MTKKSPSKNKKEVIAQIQSFVDNDVPKQMILDKLKKEYFDEQTLSKFIASVTNRQSKAKYKYLNNILLGLLIFTALLKILLGISLVLKASILLFPLVILLPILNLWFAYEISHYRGYIYRIVGLFGVIGILRMLTNNDSDTGWMYFDLAIGATITVLSLYLGKEMYPNYGLFGPKKDDKGNVLLE